MCTSIVFTFSRVGSVHHEVYFPTLQVRKDKSVVGYHYTCNGHYISSNDRSDERMY